ncbi:MAG: lactate utilization protein [Clostridiaceae bacterium]|nr:lactate utilization protein [Clostridiaceae bacterium]
MDKNISWYIDNKINLTIENLQKRNMEGYVVNDENGLIDLLKSLIPPNSVVSAGDSLTLSLCGVFDFLRGGPFIFLDKHKEGLTKEDKRKIYLKTFNADFFLSGTNAITEKGELYNIDGNGSRIAPIIYGPKNVIIVCGYNKIVRNLEEAQNRVRQYAAPLDAKRLGKNTPCTTLGCCIDCNSPQRICNSFVTITGQFEKGRIKVIFVKKELGF